MHDKEHKGASYDDICELKKRLIKIVESELNTSNIGSIDTKELGEVVDMIKDLAEAEKNCQEACYYESIVEAMEESDGEHDRYGYTKKTRMRMQDMPYVRDWEDYDYMEPRMKNMRMGYPRDRYDSEMEGRDDRYGRAFNEFKKARRHYTETKSMTDKQMMEEHANEHLADSMQTLKEIWESSEPTLRKRMKEDLTKFTSSLPA